MKCGYCHSNTAAGCEFCTPEVYGKIEFLEPTVPDIYKELAALKERVEKLERELCVPPTLLG